MQRIAAIAAMSENRAIGKNNKLLWKLPDDWANFRRVTAGKAFIMGRKSYEAEDALISDYRNVIITHQKDLKVPENTLIANSPEEALELVQDESEVFVLGGAAIFKQMLPMVNYLYLTIVHHVFDGDAYFPEIDWSDWRLIKSDYHPVDKDHAYPFSLNEYELVR
ncbi:MAG: dihydrofolate reductase [Saprospiraceae bacterium]|nr:dihydrofolate reductase [Lewinella sp.]